MVIEMDLVQNDGIHLSYKIILHVLSNIAQYTDASTTVPLVGNMHSTIRSRMF
jgi:hypothetical protein